VSKGTPPHRLSWRARIVLTAGGILLAASALEIGLRIASRFHNPALDEGWSSTEASSGEYWAIYDPDLGYRQNPRFSAFNSDGLLDHPIPPKGTYFRVLILGDSIAVYGNTIEDTFVGHLRTELRDKPGFIDTEVINAGIKGYTNYQEVLYLKKYGLKFQPDLVGVEFCLNDLFKFLQAFRVENGHLMPGTYEFSPDAVKEDPSWIRRMAKKSYLLVWMSEKLPVVAKLAEWRATGGFSFDYKADVSNAWKDQPWEDIERQLRELLQLGQANHFGVFLTVVPMAVQYREDYLARDHDYVLKPQHKLRVICERLNIPFHDFYSDLRAEFFMQDGLHLNGDGRQAVGRSLATYLIQTKLLRPNNAPGKQPDGPNEKKSSQ
jgi:lysophospholipase L1-like esterase